MDRSLLPPAPLASPDGPESQVQLPGRENRIGSRGSWDTPVQSAAEAKGRRPPPPPFWLPQAAQFCPRLCPQGLKKMPPEKLSRIPELIEPWFIFSLIWSVGATGDSTSRSKFSHWLRIKMKTENVRGSRPSWLGWAPRAGTCMLSAGCFGAVPQAQGPRANK